MILLLFISVLPVTNLAITIYNFFTAPRLTVKKSSDHNSFISVLIPARNEAGNIGKCLECLINQTYKNTEIIVLDDNSDDNTLSIAEDFSLKDERIRVIRGRKLPGDWLGKNWACKQLSEAAQGDFFLFIDADVRLSDEAIESVLYEINNTNSDMLSVFPKQVMISFGEKITVSILGWLLLSFLPVKKIHDSKNANFSAAVGQFMLWKKNVYIESGGHSAVKSKIVEDLELARYLKRKGYKIILYISGGLVRCRMYQSFKEAVNGFTKNFYPSSNSGASIFFLRLFYFSASYLIPLLLFPSDVLYLYLLILIFFQRIIVSLITRNNVLMDLFIYPFQIPVMLFTSINSFISFKKDKLYWKKRKL